MPLVKFWKKFASCPSIFARILKFKYFRGDWAYAEPNFLERYPKKFFQLGPIWWLPKRFFKLLISFSRNLHFNLGFWEHTRKRFVAHWAFEERLHRTLSIRGTNFRACSASSKMWTVFRCKFMLSIRRTNFIAHWAYTELISSHTEHAFIAGWAYAEMFKSWIAWPNRIWFSKISCYRPLDHKVLVSAKKFKNKISCLCTFKLRACLFRSVNYSTHMLGKWHLGHCHHRQRSKQIINFHQIFLLIHFWFTQYFLPTEDLYTVMIKCMY